MPDAQSLSPGAVAAKGRGPGAVDAVAAHVARPPVSQALSLQRPRLAGAVQGLSDPAGRAFSHRPPLHGKKRPAGRARPLGSRLALGKPRSRIARGGSDLLSPLPVPLPRDWARLVNQTQSETEVAAVRASIARGRPFGNATWTRLAATKLGLESSLRPRGRPRNDEKK